ncbi:unnamed protein product [Brassica rapa]|uniref:Uncharacterized protein n=3 Tax=Brassica TaxID=3705 RepID=A0A8D9M3V5_BRACM|nr:unnamed protein product [Brassica rapa]
MNVHFANATQVKWSVQVCFLLQYSYGPRPQPSSKIVELAERTTNDFVLRHEGESKTRGWNQKSIGKGKACVHKIPVYLVTRHFGDQ